jgi:CHAD domain-containing protein
MERISEAQLGDVVARAITDGVARLVGGEALVRQEDDNPHGVHQTRVATRRLRSDLRTFRGALDPKWATELRAELGWLGDVLGAARDADVLRQRLTERGKALPPGSAAGVKEAMTALAERRARAHAALLEALGSERARILIERLTEAAQAAPLAGEADRPASMALPRIVRGAYKALDRGVRSLADPPSDTELHAVRIRAKRCRYAAEACAPTLGKPARRLARAAEALQGALGELSDAVATEQWLRDFSEHADSSAGAFAAGELAVLEQAAAFRARSRWPKAWSAVKAASPTQG